MNNVIWHPKARAIIKKLSKEVKNEFGYLIFRLQTGDLLEMPQARPMSIAGHGTYELRVRGDDGNYRLFYYLKHPSGILLFHAFKKKTNQTPPREIDSAGRHLKEMLYDL
ncbi:MAG: type II toxin-antitoxin system RelE/ParE family toxin [Pseudomonadota bacterium]